MLVGCRLTTRSGGSTESASEHGSTKSIACRLGRLCGSSGLAKEAESTSGRLSIGLTKRITKETAALLLRLCRDVRRILRPKASKQASARGRRRGRRRSWLSEETKATSCRLCSILLISLSVAKQATSGVVIGAPEQATTRRLPRLVATEHYDISSGDTQYSTRLHLHPPAAGCC